MLSFDQRVLTQSGAKNIDGIKGKNARKKTNNEWFETQDSIAYWDDFNKQKLTYTPVNSEYRFALVSEQYVFNNSLFLITGEDIDILCAFCNSSVIKFYLSNTLSNDCYQYGSKEFFINLPIIKIKNERIKTMLKASVVKISQEYNSDTYNVIDKTIYELYEITHEEAVFIQKYLCMEKD